MSKKALIIVDVQEDFVNGSLAVTGARDIIPLIEKELEDDKYDYVIMTMDKHPENHCSFEKNGGMWPRHCVDDGCIPAFDVPNEVTQNKMMIWFKGINPCIDSYSTFKDNNKNDLGFDLYLKSLGITEVSICGLALDYCVKYTAIDAVIAGYEVTLLESLTRSVEPKNDDAVIEELQIIGVSIVTHEG